MVCRLLLVLLCISVIQAEETRRPSVLFVEYQKQEHYFTYFKQYLRELHAKGFEVNHTTLKEPIEDLAKYDVVVYLNVPNWDSKTQEVTEDFKRQCVRLHPFTCDRPEVFLTLVQTGEKEFLLSANNPTPESVNVKITKSKFFDLTTKEEVSVEIAAGDEVVLKL
jgi:hypothetical protein